MSIVVIVRCLCINSQAFCILLWSEASGEENRGKTYSLKGHFGEGGNSFAHFPGFCGSWSNSSSSWGSHYRHPLLSITSAYTFLHQRDIHFTSSSAPYQSLRVVLYVCGWMGTGSASILSSSPKKQFHLFHNLRPINFCKIILKNITFSGLSSINSSAVDASLMDDGWRAMKKLSSASAIITNKLSLYLVVVASSVYIKKNILLLINPGMTIW